MSFILIDAGNSCLKMARINDLNEMELDYDILNYSDLYHVLLNELRDEVPSEVLVCSVSNPATFHIIADVVHELWRVQPHLIAVEQDKYGLSTSYTNPRSLGSDRWLAMIAARHDFSNTLCVIDCGTAVTIDVVADTGVHLGGLITPGLTLARDSLGIKTSNLPMIEDSASFNNESSFLAINTQDAILGGSLYQLSAYIERIVSEIKLEFGEDVQCIITGGDADKIQALTYHQFHYRETLVLEGLQIVAREIFDKENK